MNFLKVINLITIQQAVNNFKLLIEQAIEEDGNVGKTAMIRSSQPILNLHEAVKTQLINNGVNSSLIYPPLGTRRPEIKLAGALKQKNQDICILPNNINLENEVLLTGLLEGVIDPYGIKSTNRILTINVRSQISSIQKNFDTLYERIIFEAQNLHERCPEIVLGEMYMIAVPEYDDREFKNNTIKFRNVSPALVKKYIKSFKAISGRRKTDKNFFQYEASCLLIVDFSKNPPKIYTSTSELIQKGLLDEDTDVHYEGLGWNDFIANLISAYENRFGIGSLS